MKKLISILVILCLVGCKTSKSGCDAYAKVSVKKTTNTTK
jgi:hypothetical protein